MKIRKAKPDDVSILSKYENHIEKGELCSLVKLGRMFIAEKDDAFIGWLRWNLFWDNTPFMNMLFLLDGYRNKGYGKEIVAH